MSTAIDSDVRPDQPAPATSAAGEVTPEAPGDAIRVIMESDGYELLLAHPNALYLGKDVTENTRQTVVEDDTFASDIKDFGVEVVIEARRDKIGRVAVHDGKMRTLAARKAGIPELLVLVRPNDNDDERDATVMRIFSQLRINEQRSDIPEADKLAALHQLVLLDVTPKELAAQRHMPLKDAKKLHKAASSKAVIQAAHAAQHVLTLDQMLVIAEFEGDDESVATLTETAQTWPRSLENKASELRQKRRDAALYEALREKLAKSQAPLVTEEELAGDNLSAELTELRPSPGHEPGTVLTTAAHKSCPGNAVRIEFVGYGSDRKAAPVYLCRNFREYGHAQLNAPKGVAALKAGGKMTPEELADHHLKIKFNKQWVQSAEPRQAWMLEKFRGNTFPKGYQIQRRIAQLTRAAGYEIKRSIEREHPLLSQCLASKAKTSEARKAAVQKVIDGASEERAAMINLGFVAFAIEENISRHKTSWNTRSAETVLLMTVLKELGKELTEVENYILGLDEHGKPLDGTTDAAVTSSEIDAPDSTAIPEQVAA